MWPENREITCENQPHMRGGKSAILAIPHWRVESTPHAWGKELIKQTQTVHKYRKIKIF